VICAQKQLEAPAGVQFQQIASSMWHHTCGIDLDKNMRCWGYNGSGQAPAVSLNLTILLDYHWNFKYPSDF
jgi:hypothetical protein